MADITFSDAVHAALGYNIGTTEASHMINSTLVSTSGGGTTNYLRADGTWAPAGSGGGSGTVTSVGVSSSSLTVTGSPVTTSGVIDVELPAGGITNAQLAVAPALTVKCNPTNASANDQDFAASSGNQVLQTNSAGTALTWGPFGTGVQVRGATWQGGNAAITVAEMTDVTILNPIDMQVTRVTITTKGGTGSCTCDCWTSAAYPPVSANTIFSTTPSISSGNHYDDTVLSGVSTPHIPAGNYLTFHLISTSVFTEIVFHIALTPTQTVASSGYTDAQAVAAVKAAMSNTGNVISSGAVGVITQNYTPSSSLISANGYIVLPGGLYMQWGSFAAPSGGPVSATFPIAFPTACFVVVPSQGQSTSYGYPFAITGKSTTGFVASDATGGILAGTCYYIAIGN